MAKLSAPQTTQAITKDSSKMIQPGVPGMASCIQTMMVQLVSAPTMSTSPWAKLMRLMMP
jgi:hypothetical protein